MFLKKDRQTLTWLYLLILLIYLCIALFASLHWIGADFSQTQMDLSYSPPSSQHWLGTDFLGRDVLARALQGTKLALFVGSLAALLATGLGLVLGALAGFLGGVVDDLIVWLYTTLESIPAILLISAFAFSLGQGIPSLILALGLTGWVKLCRLIRAEFLSHKNRDYVVAAKALGTSSSSQIFKHILPNVSHLALVQFNLSFISAIKYEVILSYLGLGVEPGTPSWGLMINDAKTELTRGIWWNLSAATLFMFVLILTMHLLTDALQDNKQA